MTRLVVFDCDGTLVDGQAAVCEAMEMAFAEVGIAPPARHTIRRSVGLSLPQALSRLVPGAGDATRNALDAAYRTAFRSLREAGTLQEPLFDGIRAVLETLGARNWKLGVATGKSDRGLDHCLASHDLTALFVTLQTADRHPSKPHPAMLEAALAQAGASAPEAVMIGDTQYDITMARAAGVRAIGVAWGYHEPSELFAAGADAVADTPAHLLELLP